MTTLAFRASLEVTEHPRSKEISGRLLNWLTTEQINDELDPIERAILETPYGRLERFQVVDATMAEEGACLMLWAIGIGEPLPQRFRADARMWVERLGILRKPQDEFVRESRLRPEDELKPACLEILLTQSILRQLRIPDESAREIIRRADENRAKELGLSPTESARLRCRSSVESLTPEEQLAVSGLLLPRSLAASWLFDTRSNYFES